MKKGGICLTIFLMLFIFQQQIVAQQDSEKLFLSIKELSGSDPDEAERKLQDYIQMGVETRDEKITANVYYLLGRINLFKSRNFISNEYYELALKCPYAKKELSFAESCYNNMGVNYDIQNLIPEALKAYQKSLGYAEKLKDSVSIYQTQINIGLLNAKVRKYDKAREITQKSLDFFIKKKDILNQALCYQNLGYIQSEQKSYGSAIQYYHKCLLLNKLVDNQYEVLNLTFNLGLNYFEYGLQSKSEKYLNETLKLALEQDRRDILAKIYIQLGESHTKENKFKQAEIELLKAQKLIDENEIFDLQPFLFAALTSLYAKSGDFEAYMNAIDESREMEKSRTVKESIARTDEVQALYEFQKNVQQINNLAKNIETKRNQMYILGSLIIFLAIVLTIFIFQHLKARRYMRTLFESQLEKTLHHFPSNEAVSTSKSHLMEVYDKIIEYTNKTGASDISLVSKNLGIREEDVAESIRLFGKNEKGHIFFQTFFIEELCKKMIQLGKNISLKNAVDNSPFTSFSDFTKRFREVTGLKPEQFINYCDARLKERRKLHS